MTRRCRSRYRFLTSSDPISGFYREACLLAEAVGVERRGALLHSIATAASLTREQSDSAHQWN